MKKLLNNLKAALNNNFTPTMFEMKCVDNEVARSDEPPENDQLILQLDGVLCWVSAHCWSVNRRRCKTSTDHNRLLTMTQCPTMTEDPERISPKCYQCLFSCEQNVCSATAPLEVLDVAWMHEDVAVLPDMLFDMHFSNTRMCFCATIEEVHPHSSDGWKAKYLK